MKSLAHVLPLTVMLCGCSQSPPALPVTRQVELPPRLESYFKQYCNATGGMGIGSVAEHTYDYRFRQHLKHTQDPELKRLYVLQNLHQSVDWHLRDFEAGVSTGKGSSRPLTPSEWQAARQRLLEQIEDLATYAAYTNFARARVERFSEAVEEGDVMDLLVPGQDQRWIEVLRQRITNALAANKIAPANARR